MDSTAVIRLKDEAEWLPLCIETIKDIFDEILLCTQGEQSDDTIEICKSYSCNTIKHYHYRFESRPNGPGFKYQRYDQFSRTYFYNWCFNHAETEWVCKWDGDMLALPRCKSEIQSAIKANTSLKFKGVDVVDDLYHIGKREFCSPETRLYKKGKYIQGDMCEVLKKETPHATKECHEPLFIHTKWAKKEYSIVKAWPSNWRDIPKFQNLWQRKTKLKEHDYRIPEEWLKYVDGKS